MLIKKLYTADNLREQTNLFTKGEVFQAFLLPSIFLITNCSFYKSSSNDIMVIKVYVDKSESEEVFTGNMLNRKLTKVEIRQLNSEVKKVFRTMPGKKLIYI